MSAIGDWLTRVQEQIGKPYVFGDEGPASFDCSGLVQYTLGQIGITAPRIAAQQQAWATPVGTPQPGDLVFYGQPAYHVGIYIGNGQMIDAPHSGANVRVDQVRAGATYGRIPGLGGTALANLGLGIGGDWVDKILAGGRKVLFEGLAVAAGLALVGAGLWQLDGVRRGAKALTSPGRLIGNAKEVLS